jgi:8-oxo-dGTP diphosphatase
MSKRIDVVSAVLLNQEGRILLTQRRPGKPYPFMWESPGGKVEAGESDRGALTRELRQEIGILLYDMDPQPIWEGEPAPGIFLRFYSGILFAGEPKPKEGQGIGWFLQREVSAMAAMADSLTPGNKAAMVAISACMRAAMPREDW